MNSFKELNGTIIQGKTREILDATYTESGEATVIFVCEAEATMISINGRSSPYFYEVYAIAGDRDNHEVLLYRSPTVSSNDVEQRILGSTGKLRFKLIYEGAMTVEVSAIGVSGAAAHAAAELGALPTNIDTLVYRDQSINILKRIEEQLLKLNRYQAEMFDGDID